ncbi:uncharacterized protein [Ptychodera flava]|uniref:uncharacterized protein n=1 Tax=Ptychodera flava TaxID=63121 RepID=UPI00396A3670
MKLLRHASGSWFGRGFDHGRQQGNSLTVCFRRYHLKMSSQRRVKAVGTRHFDGNSITRHGIQPLYVGMRLSSSMSRQEPATVERFLRSDTLTSEEDKDLSKRQYPFENLVFEGGGTKGIAYAGVMKVLMDVGVWPNIKRFGGTSVGAMIACMLAVDYSPNKVVEMMDKELGPIAVDHSFGILSLLPNLIRHYGWNPGKKLLDWFGDKLAEKTGNRDITFKQLYDQYGKELCIVVCNVTQMNAEYCHVKTTPDMPIRLAVRMSMSIPGFYQAVKSTLGANESVYVDGGVLVNYPVHCYDGWWLSLNSDDSFLVRLQPLSHIHKMWNKKRRFGEFNEKTLGVLLCSESEPEVFEGLILGENDTKIPRPDTKLAR